MARELMPELILMDWQMPVMDGLTATQILKADPATRHIPIIVVTAYAMTAIANARSLLAATSTSPSRSMRSICARRSRVSASVDRIGRAQPWRRGGIEGAG